MRTLPLSAVCLAAALILAGCSDDPLTDVAPSDGAATAPTSEQIAEALAAADGFETDELDAEAARGFRLFRLGESIELGDGSVTTFAGVLPNGRPWTVGAAITAGALHNLPPGPNDGRGCFDVSGDGVIDPHMECLPGYEHILDLPPELQTEGDSPFQYLMLNWNPMGHPPPHVYTVPHFDVHFYIQDFAEVEAMVTGPCPGLMDCAVFDSATQPIPPQYMPQDYLDVQATEARMGNHFIDPTSPEFNGEPFTRTFIYGGFGGEITFYEPMLTRDYLLSRARECTQLKLPEVWAEAGHYPTRYCTRYAFGVHFVTLETFRYREAG